MLRVMLIVFLTEEIKQLIELYEGLGRRRPRRVSWGDRYVALVKGTSPTLAAERLELHKRWIEALVELRDLIVHNNPAGALTPGRSIDFRTITRAGLPEDPFHLDDGHLTELQYRLSEILPRFYFLGLQRGGTTG